MSILNYVIITIHIVICLLLILFVLSQSEKQTYSGAVLGDNGSNSFFQKSKVQPRGSLLKKITTVVSFLFLISSITITGVTKSNNKQEPVPQTIDESNIDVSEDSNLEIENIPTQEEKENPEGVKENTEEKNENHGENLQKQNVAEVSKSPEKTEKTEEKKETAEKVEEKETVKNVEEEKETVEKVEKIEKVEEAEEGKKETTEKIEEE